VARYTGPKRQNNVEKRKRKRHAIIPNYEGETKNALFVGTQTLQSRLSRIMRDKRKTREKTAKKRVFCVPEGDYP
jgi:hypothetical protein